MVHRLYMTTVLPVVTGTHMTSNNHF